ncbi:hypothetical protein [Polyangium aurulentum]|uniref:hypothetical protein n=1 Tax=Polyangium aurulentum TaxID=2567896 RepID=UPI0010AEB362|nr:hypothetical protein [Polyangium aurulentum]UQA62113.1 hypothetical protein E8A73_017210 [Polyangium aurulentum]
MSDPKNPVPGDQIIDASDIELVDITPEEIQKFLKIRDGIDKAMANVLRLKSTEIERAGLSPNDVQRAITLIKQYQRIEALLPAAEKLAEKLGETRALRAHEVNQLLGEIASQARRRGERDSKGGEIMGPLADLFDYQYGPARKSAATRAKANATPPQEDAPADNGS